MNKDFSADKALTMLPTRLEEKRKGKLEIIQDNANVANTWEYII